MIVGSSPVSDKYIFLAFLVHYSQYFVLFYSSKIDLKAFRRKQEFLRTKDREISLCMDDVATVYCTNVASSKSLTNALAGQVTVFLKDFLWLSLMI